MLDRWAGEAAALMAAFFWAATTLMFGELGRQLPPLILNWLKGVFAIAFIVLTLALQRSLAAPAALPTLTAEATFLLLLSGGIGIGLGDTAYFTAINALGARRALLLETLSPAVATVLAWVFLAERLNGVALIGIGLTLAGIAWVIGERVAARDPVERWSQGLGAALLAVFCQAAGAVLSRAALNQSVIDPLWSTLLRLLAGMAFISLLTLTQPWQTIRSRAVDTLRKPALLGLVALAALLATYLGIWLQQIALKHTAAGVAQALLATSPLFVLPMAAALGDRISVRAITGAMIALSGVWLLFAR